MLIEKALDRLRDAPRKWLVTGAAGFIGSNLVETLLQNGQYVVGFDDFSTGHRHNLDAIRNAVPADAWGRFTFIEGDIRNLDSCRTACSDVQHVLHQAALGSVPWSIEDPVTSNAVNISGFVNMLVAARDAKVDSFVYAASSATYGDEPTIPKVEEKIGRSLSPYAVTKYVNELYADVFDLSYGFRSIGLRYFNVFGERQDPDGPYAAVIPKWAASMAADQLVEINGDGETTRDFCYIANVVQANILASLAPDEARGQVYNVAGASRTTLNELFAALRGALEDHGVHYPHEPVYRPFRAGDIRHSEADIEKARRLLGYEPTHSFRQGVQSAMRWYLAEAGVGGA